MVGIKTFQGSCIDLEEGEVNFKHWNITFLSNHYKNRIRTQNLKSNRGRQWNEGAKFNKSKRREEVQQGEETILETNKKSKNLAKMSRNIWEITINVNAPNFPLKKKNQDNF